MMVRFLFFLAINTVVNLGFTQNDSIQRLKFNADFRFRVEHDWNSRKSDGTYRDDRTRFRYRMRAGMTYQYNSWAGFGVSVRTGQINKQQDPQLTLGSGAAEFSTLPIGFEKAYFKAEFRGISGWAGKNTFPFKKHNELFWSDNVFPEGIALSYALKLNHNVFNKVKLNIGHFIVNANNKLLATDAYFQGAQTELTCFDGRIIIFPGFYYFKNLPNIPDGAATYTLNYKIGHIGLSQKYLDNRKLSVELDYYYNFENLAENENVSDALSQQVQGGVAGIKYGDFKAKGSWQCAVYGIYLERYSAVDFLAQNDWARWDYSQYNSPDGRLTNLRGLEFFGWLCV